MQHVHQPSSDHHHHHFLHFSALRIDSETQQVEIAFKSDGTLIESANCCEARRDLRNEKIYRVRLEAHLFVSVANDCWLNLISSNL